jgi:hypothetical protein
VPFSNVFDTSIVKQGAETFQVEFDPDQGASQGSNGAGASSDFPSNNRENDEAFGEVFIDSPNPSSVSSLALQSDWVITSCHPTSDQPQQVHEFHIPRRSILTDVAGPCVLLEVRVRTKFWLCTRSAWWGRAHYCENAGQLWKRAVCSRGKPDPSCQPVNSSRSPPNQTAGWWARLLTVV